MVERLDSRVVDGLGVVEERRFQLHCAHLVEEADVVEAAGHVF